MTTLAWTLWASLTIFTIPQQGEPYAMRDVVERFETYAQCDSAARWAESQEDLREAFHVENGRRYRVTMSFDCGRTP